MTVEELTQLRQQASQAAADTSNGQTAYPPELVVQLCDQALENTKEEA